MDHPAVAQLDSAVERLTLNGLTYASAVDDEGTQVSRTSGQAPSVSGKSQASGLDEKDSLRPDDSASMQAGDDDETSTRYGSETGGRAYTDLSDHNPAALLRLPLASRRMITDIQEEEPPGPSSTMTNLGDVPALAVPSTLRQPDEKLFEALESAKDRIFLLRLEQDITDFIQNSSNPSITLPPCNSFGRLLAHKLADYYGLTHFVDNAVSAVTLYRAAKSPLPPPLHVLADARTQGERSFVPAVQPAVKIMRRPGLGKETPSESSNVASKAASEAGDDVPPEYYTGGEVSPSGSHVHKDKAMTRAEREARYREKREELFGPPATQTESTSLSRSSSCNDKVEDKKRHKKKSTCDDGFEARSQFNAYYPPVNYDVPPDPAFYNAYGMPSYPPPQSMYYPPPPMSYPCPPPIQHGGFVPGHGHFHPGPYPPHPSGPMPAPSFMPPQHPVYPMSQQQQVWSPPFVDSSNSKSSSPPISRSRQKKLSATSCQFGQMPYQALPLHESLPDSSGEYEPAYLPPSQAPPFPTWTGNPATPTFEQPSAFRMAPGSLSSEYGRRQYGSASSNTTAATTTSSLAKWGTPANLPPKPPPLDTPNPPESLPQAHHFRVSSPRFSQSNGHDSRVALPHFQNGVYNARQRTQL